ncbi:MAG: MBL fold metallo-hydrolase [Pseudomonadota bacterium]
MTQTPKFSRRAALAGGLAAPVAFTLGQAHFTEANAAAPMLGTSMPQFNRMMVGGFEVTTLLAGTRVVEDPQNIFGMNVSADEFSAASAANHLPANKVRFYFTPTVVNTGSELVLFDTGLSPESITGALAAAGYTPDQIDKVVVTHFHGDHIGGLGGANPTFANAAYYTSEVEFGAYDGNEKVDALVKPLADKMTMLKGGGAVASGITAVEAFGHSPGHMTFMLESDGKQLLIAADFANHYVWSLGYPDWEVKFDRDKAAAAATRRQILGMLATDKVPFIGYHMPFPAVGFVETAGDGFRYMPATYQMTM